VQGNCEGKELVMRHESDVKTLERDGQVEGTDPASHMKADDWLGKVESLSCRRGDSGRVGAE
jgi:hypothetical protein